MILHQQTHFLNQLKLGSSKKSMYFDTRITAKTKPIALLLQKLNILRRFCKLKGGLYRVFPAYSRYRRLARTITFYTKSSGRIVLTYKSLRILNINSPHSYYVLETSKGLMTHKEALRLKLGGLLLLVIR